MLLFISVHNKEDLNRRPHILAIRVLSNRYKMDGLDREEEASPELANSCLGHFLGTKNGEYARMA